MLAHSNTNLQHSIPVRQFLVLLLHFHHSLHLEYLYILIHLHIYFTFTLKHRYLWQKIMKHAKEKDKQKKMDIRNIT